MKYEKNNKEIIVKFDELEQYIYKYYINGCRKCKANKNSCNVLNNILPIELVDNIKKFQLLL